AMHGHGRAGGVGAASACDQRRLRRAAGAYQVAYLRVFGRKNHGIGLGLTTRVVVAVGEALGRVERERVAGEDSAQRFLEVSAQRHGAQYISREDAKTRGKEQTNPKFAFFAPSRETAGLLNRQCRPARGIRTA